MPDDDARTRRCERRALFRYLAVWIAGGALVATSAVWLVERFGEEQVSLPPVRQVELADAARSAECRLRRVRPGERTRPVVDGPAGMPAAAAGVYEQPAEPYRLVAAMRRGSVVIHYSPALPDSSREQLERLHEAMPEGTIVTPDGSGMPDVLAVTAFRRILGCPRYDRRTFEAVRLFQGRFVGTGPDG